MVTSLQLHQVLAAVITVLGFLSADCCQELLIPFQLYMYIVCEHSGKFLGCLTVGLRVVLGILPHTLNVDLPMHACDKLFVKNPPLCS